MVAVHALSPGRLSGSPTQPCSVVPPEAGLHGKAAETGAMHLETGKGQFMIGT